MDEEQALEVRRLALSLQALGPDCYHYSYYHYLALEVLDYPNIVRGEN